MPIDRPAVRSPGTRALVPSRFGQIAQDYWACRTALDSLRRRRTGESDRASAVDLGRGALAVIDAERSARQALRLEIARHVAFLKEGGASLADVLEEIRALLGAATAAVPAPANTADANFDVAHWVMDAYLGTAPRRAVSTPASPREARILPLRPRHSGERAS